MGEIEPELLEATAGWLDAQQAYERTRAYAPATIEERQAAFDAMVRFEQQHADDPLTGELVRQYVEGPMQSLIKTTLGHLPDLNYDVALNFRPRPDFDAWLLEGDSCDRYPDNPQDITTNGISYFYLGSRHPTEITVPDTFRVRLRASDREVTETQVTTLADLRDTLLHEVAGHAAIRTSYRYYPKSGEGSIYLHGMAIVDGSLDEECPVYVWWNVNEAAVNLLVLELNREDESVTMARMLGAFGEQALLDMRALEFFVVQAAGMSRMEFLEYVLGSSNLIVEGQLDRRINARIEAGLLEAEADGEPLAIERRALDLIQWSQTEAFYQLMEGELGLTREVAQQER